MKSMPQDRFTSSWPWFVTADIVKTVSLGDCKHSGLNAAQAMPLVQELVEICGECREEFEALLAALRATGER